MTDPEQNPTDPLFHQSLTPVNVIHQIRQDILLFFGLTKDLSELETKLVDVIEQIVRKGACPSLVHEDPMFIRALEAFAKVFSQEKVLIEQDGDWLELPVFATLINAARQAHAQKVRFGILRGLLPHPDHAIQHQAVSSELEKLRTERSHRALMYQRVVFNHSSQLREQDPARTLLSESGKAHIDALLPE